MKDLIAEAPELATARTTVIDDCLRRAGFDMPADLASDAPAGGGNLAGAVDVFSSVESARLSGYASSTTDKSSAPTLDDYVQTLPKSDQDHFSNLMFGSGTRVAQITQSNGVRVQMSEKGCLADGTRSVYGSVKNYLEYSSFRNELAAHIAVQDEIPGQADVMAKYSDCMAASGVTVRDVGATREIAKKKFGESRALGSSPSPAEQQLAVTDASCQQKAGMLAWLNKKVLRDAGSWINAHQAWILGLLELRKASIARASAILNGQ